MYMTTLSSFKDNNMYSKKEWLFPDKVVFYSTFFITPFIVLFLFFDIYKIILGITKLRWVVLLVILYYSYLISDYISAFIHCHYIDGSYSKKEYKMEGEYIVIDTYFGYASCHHIFPSCWKDVQDSTIVVTMSLILSIPILLGYLFVSYSPIRLFIYLVCIFSIVTIFTHKYAHEKLHNRYVPSVINMLINAGLALSPKKHQKHHMDNNYSWAFLSGKTDVFFNLLIHFICWCLKRCPMEESIRNIKNQPNHEDIKIKFVGDIEGTITCKMRNNRVVEKTTPPVKPDSYETR